jgi:Flp pilus assembly pilin Flp
MRSGKRFLGSDAGSASIEYALLAAIVGLGLTSVLNNTKNRLNDNFNSIAAKLNIDYEDRNVRLNGINYNRSTKLNNDGSVTITMARLSDGHVEYTENYDRFGNLFLMKRTDFSGSYYDDRFSKNPDGSYTVSFSSNGGSATIEYNQKREHINGYDIITRTFSDADAPGTGKIQVYVIQGNTEESHAAPDLNPNLVGRSDLKIDGSIVSTGSALAEKYLRDL